MKRCVVLHSLEESLKIRKETLSLQSPMRFQLALFAKMREALENMYVRMRFVLLRSMEEKAPGVW